MPTIFSEALSPLAKRRSHAVRDIEILRVCAQLDGDDFEAALSKARSEVLAWAKRRAGRPLPKEAWDYRDFELLAGGRNSTAVRISDGAMDLWALRAEDPDKNIAGRVWSTEVVVGGEVGSRPHVSVRLIVNTEEQDLDIETHVPGLVRQMIEAPGLVRGSRPLHTEPLLIESVYGAEDLCDHLEDPVRRLPIFVATVPAGGGASSLLDVSLVARATAGLARTVVLPADLTWILTERFGKYRSVFDGGVRAYMRGFSATDDPYRHRLFLEENLRKTDYANACVNWLRKTASNVSISETRLGKEVLDFATVRTASRRLKSRDLTERAAPDSELLETTVELVESLEKQVDQKDKEIDGYIELAESAEDRALSSEHENRSLLFKVRHLQRALANGGEAPTSEPPLPQQWSDFGDWLDETYPDRILLTPSARRMARTPEFEDVTLVARSITWLATVQHDRRIHGGGSLRDVVLENGIVNAPCGGDTYPADWKGRRYDVDWHIKTGGNTRDPRKCLRIYYFWEPETMQTVIDYLPSHRRTDRT